MQFYIFSGNDIMWWHLQWQSSTNNGVPTLQNLHPLFKERYCEMFMPLTALLTRQSLFIILKRVFSIRFPCIQTLRMRVLKRVQVYNIAKICNRLLYNIQIPCAEKNVSIYSWNSFTKFGNIILQLYECIRFNFATLLENVVFSLVAHRDFIEKDCVVRYSMPFLKS